MKTFSELKIGDTIYFFAGDIYEEKIIKEWPVCDIRRNFNGKYVIDVIAKEHNIVVSLFEKDLNIGRSTDNERYFSDLDLAKEEVRKTIAKKKQKLQDKISEIQKDIDRLIVIDGQLQ